MKFAFVPAVESKSSALERLAFASILQKIGGRKTDSVESIVAQRWPQDRTTRQLVTRADQTVGSTGAAGWGAEVAGDAWGEFLGTLQPYSAMAQIMAQGTVSPFDGRAEKRHPVRTSAAAPMAWVEETDAIPVTEYVMGNATLVPKKMAVISLFSRELARYSDAENIFGTIFREDAGLSLDAAYLSADAVSDAAHAGLLDGVTATTQSANVPAENLANLAAAVASGGSGEVVFITSQARAAQYPLLHPESKATMLGSAAVPADRVIAIDPRGLVHGFSGMPDIDIAREGSVHMSDTPLEVVSGTGPTTADPVRSLYQTDAMAMRMFLEIAFAKRRSTAVAYSDGINW